MLPPRRSQTSVLQHTMGKLLRQAGYRTVFGGKTHWANRLTFKTCGFDRLTRDSRDQLAEDCVEFLRQDHSQPFLLVASFINPHDICYVEIDATIKRYGLPPFCRVLQTLEKQSPKRFNWRSRPKQQGTFDQICPPLVKNHGPTANEPPALAVKPVRQPPPGERRSSHVYYYMNDFVYREWTDSDWRMHHWIYHRLVEDVDRQIGRVLEALYETGLDKNTVVIFTSDHGDMDGAHKRVHKSFFYDESARVPFIVAGPGVQPGVDQEHLVSSSLDLIPTICDFAGVPTPDGLAGQSLKSLAEGKTDQQARSAVFSENGRGRMVRTRRYKYCWYKAGQPSDMLIDMENDPGEMTNLAPDPKYATIVAQHRELIRKHVRDCDDKRFPLIAN